MIKITIPANNIEERKYILDVIFGEFLDLKYEIITDKNNKNWTITLKNSKQLIVEDSFFNKNIQNLDYLNLINIPSQILFANNSFITADDIPIIYGNDKLETSDNIIICGIDIFASSFFMLTRWEEYVNKNRDKHDRFLAIESLAYKGGFLNRPIVNEYIEMLKNMLISLDNTLEFKKHTPKMLVTCDVDQPFDCSVENVSNLIRACGGDLLKRKSFKDFLSRIRRFIFNKFGNYKYDENYTFDWYMSVCERASIEAKFYFIPDNAEKGNGCYRLKDAKIQKLLKYIDSRGHEIGVHGSYQTYQDKDKAKLQKNMLDNVLKNLNISQKIIGNRQHYLRWDSSATPAILDNCEFEYDTTGSYADMVGFRYGICYKFNMFDFIGRKKLNIKEMPLIVMECTIIDNIYMGLGYSEESLQMMKELKKKCFKYNGNFTLLWHNSHFKNKEDKNMFEKIVNA